MSAWVEPLVAAIESGMTAADAIEKTGAFEHLHNLYYVDNGEPHKSKSMGVYDDVLENARHLMMTYKQARAELEVTLHSLPESLDYKDYIQNLGKLILIETDHIHGSFISPQTRTCTKILLETNLFLKTLPTANKKDISRYLKFAKSVIVKKPSPPIRLVMGAALMLAGAVLFAIGIKLSLLGVTSLIGTSIDITGAGFKLFQNAVSKESLDSPINRKVEILYASLSADMKNLTRTAPIAKAAPSEHAIEAVHEKPRAPIDEMLEKEEFHTDAPFEQLLYSNRPKRQNTDTDTDGEGLKPQEGN